MGEIEENFDMPCGYQNLRSAVLISPDHRSWMEETSQKLASASAQIERGEVLDGAAVIAQLQAK
jgi:hypothetical protein